MLGVWRLQVSVRQNESGAGIQSGEEASDDSGGHRVAERAVVLIKRAGFCKIGIRSNNSEPVKKIPRVVPTSARVSRAIRVIASVVHGQEGRKDVPGLANNRAENLVIINAVPGPNRSLARPERIPGESDVRGDVVGIGFVSLEPPGEEILEPGDAPPEDTGIAVELSLEIDELPDFGRVERRFDASVVLPRDGVEFVSESESQREVAADANLISEEDVVLQVFQTDGRIGNSARKRLVDPGRGAESQIISAEVESSGVD